MQNLPSPEVYEKEFKYMPWGILIQEIQSIVLEQAPKDANVLDLLCGPGYLLAQLKKKRSDLRCTGVDLEPDFIAYAKQQYADMTFIVDDAASWKSDQTYDVLLCTAGVHHLPYAQQEPFIQKLSTLVSAEGFAIVADPYIDDYSDELSRKLAGARLGYEYLAATIQNGASEDVIQAAVDVLRNDVLLIEYKNSIKKMKPLFEKYFSHVEMHKTWPQEETEYGDYYFVLRSSVTS